MDKIGWTYEDNFGIITFDYREGGTTLFSTMGQEGVPALGQKIEFGAIHLPTVFSVAVAVEPLQLISGKRKQLYLELMKKSVY